MGTARYPSDLWHTLFNWAAWWSLILPLATAPFMYALDLPENAKMSYYTVNSYLTVAIWAEIVGFLLGIVSLFGISRYGAKLILWKAALGIVASLGMAFWIVLLAIGNGMGRMGC